MSLRPSVPEGHPPLEIYISWLWERHAEDLELVVLFGSRARGDALEDSDYDLLIGLRREDGLRFIDRLLVYQDELTGRADVFPYCPSDLALMEADDNLLLLEAFADGKVLFDRGEWNRMLEAHSRAVAAGRVRRTPLCWIVRDGA